MTADDRRDEGGTDEEPAQADRPTEMDDQANAGTLETAPEDHDAGDDGDPVDDA